MARIILRAPRWVPCTVGLGTHDACGAGGEHGSERNVLEMPICFGRYTGPTPVSGNRSSTVASRLRAELAEAYLVRVLLDRTGLTPNSNRPRTCVVCLSGEHTAGPNAWRHFSAAIETASDHWAVQQAIDPARPHVSEQT